jgi:hypothetical protein
LSNATRSILVFGIYIILAGLTLIFVPNILLGIVALPAANEVWIRAFGALAVVLGTYFLQAARDNNVRFYQMTILGRLLFAFSIIVLGLTTPGHLALGVFGLIDLAGAAWTWLSMRQESAVAVKST